MEDTPLDSNKLKDQCGGEILVLDWPPQTRLVTKNFANYVAGEQDAGAIFTHNKLHTMSASCNNASNHDVSLILY